jgi:altronate dehydratase small subunit
MLRCFQISAADNVATLLDDVDSAGDVRILGHASKKSVTATAPIKLGHKIAVAPIARGQPVVKFGVAVGRASRDIAAGEWVHLHNVASGFDERSQTLDLHTGAATDTKYE